MKLTPLGIEGAWLAESAVFKDERGYFREWFKREEILESTGMDFSVQQANHSKSKKGVVRGIHYSLAPGGQAKWVTCTSGTILDVIVDLRPNSSTFKKIEYIELNDDGDRSVLLGSGLGHGFISLTDETCVAYLINRPYSPMYEFGLHPFDTEVKIDWHLSLIPQTEVTISEKDSSAPDLTTLMNTGKLPQHEL